MQAYSLETYCLRGIVIWYTGVIQCLSHIGMDSHVRGPYLAPGL